MRRHIKLHETETWSNDRQLTCDDDTVRLADDVLIGDWSVDDLRGEETGAAIVTVAEGLALEGEHGITAGQASHIALLWVRARWNVCGCGLRESERESRLSVEHYTNSSR